MYCKSKTLYLGQQYILVYTVLRIILVYCGNTEIGVSLSGTTSPQTALVDSILNIITGVITM